MSRHISTVLRNFRCGFLACESAPWPRKHAIGIGLGEALVVLHVLVAFSRELGRETHRLVDRFTSYKARFSAVSYGKSTSCNRVHDFACVGDL